MSNKKLNLFKKRRLRNRNKIKSADNKRIRMSVHRSLKNIYVQLIDDSIGSTITSASSRMSAVGKNLKNNTEIYSTCELGNLTYPYKILSNKTQIIKDICENKNEISEKNALIEKIIGS